MTDNVFTYSIFTKLNEPEIADPDHPYNQFVRNADRQTQKAAIDWCYEAGSKPDIGALLTRMSDRQLSIFKAYAAGWRVDVEFTLSFVPYELHEPVEEAIREQVAGFQVIRDLIESEHQRRLIQP
ncbi:hypothetical protein H8F21_14390 [Pseudomonas sp. P66]|uniref:Uncharacterized protein n=1 Tax=Pseudomonas arcuscaelestis TaxID=2710591 RepID=A0ABS2C0A8_9PSED|nr:hypothetical protein [Pseudomonas arcuscaelestis]MBM5458753.1 hypothetical protein [Pseudomonas arcuscaelestis]